MVSVAPAGTYDAKKLLEDQLGSLGLSGDAVIGLFAKAFEKHSDELLALLPSVADTGHRRQILDAGLAGLARDGLGLALDYIAGQPSSRRIQANPSPVPLRAPHEAGKLQ